MQSTITSCTWQSRMPLVVFCFAVAVCTFMLPISAHAQLANNPGIVPEGVTQGFASEGDMYANTPTPGVGDGTSDWFDNPVAGKLGVGVLNNDGTPRSPAIFGPGVLTIANVNDPVAPADDDGWVGGAKLVDPTTWGRVLHVANPKDEVNHVYVLETKDIITQDRWLTIAFDRSSNNGTNSPAALILQHPASFPAGAPAILTGPDNGLTNNDLALILSWSKGGNQPTIKMFKWVTSTFDTINATTLAATVFIASNAATTITLPAGYTVYNGQTTYQANTFVEISVNLTQLFLLQGVTCLPVSQVIPLTVTSQTVTSAQPKDFVAPVTIIPPTPTVTCAVDNNISCFGLCDGQITATASGGASPYSFSIDGVNFQVSPTFPGLCAGAYTITVKDASGCTATGGPCTITQPPALVANCTTDKNVSCNGGSDGQITGSASGGTAPYSFSIDGVNFQSSGVFAGLAAGTYTITAKDAHGCTATHQCTITEPPAVVAGCTTDKNVSCNGGSDGQITGSATGGTSPYTFSKDGVNFQSSGVFAGLAAGTYTITAKDANGCTGTHQCTVTEPPALVANCTTDQNSACGANNGQITGSVTGGTSPYTFSKDGVNFQSSGVFAGLAPGTYTITAKDANGCTATHQCSVISLAGPVANCTTDKNVSCNGGSDGQITGSATGGTAPYTFSKDGVNFQSSGVFAGLPAGCYTITAKDANGCTSTHQCCITEPPALVANCTTDKNTNCKNPNGGQITGSASGGTVPYTFSKDGVNFQSSGVFAGLSGSTYTITAKDANGCTATHQCTVTPDLTPPDLTAAGGTISCLDPTVQLTASSTNACAKYNWTGPNGFTSPAQNPTVSDSGNYTVTVTDTCNGCTHDTTVHVNTITPTSGGTCGAQGLVKDGFELDGNAQSDSPNPPDDWDSVYTGGSNATSTTGVDQDLPSKGQDNYFVIGTKDIVDVTQWHYNIQSTPDKDDILDAGAAEYGTLLYFMGDRFSTSGNAQIGFWFFQDTVHPDPNTNLFTGKHIVGDLLVLSNFVQGGGNSVIKAYKWVGSGGSDGALDSLPLSAGHAFAITNPASSPSPWPFDPKKGPSGSFGKGAFFEGGLDVACLPGVSACFRSFLIETRASASVTAELKDFVFGKFVANSLSVTAQALASLNRLVGTDNGEKTLSAAMPAGYALHANYPNPFNPTTQIKFDLPEQSVVRLSVYNILGQEVAVLVNGIVDAGYREVEWNSRTQAGVGLPSGIYMFRIHATSVSSGKEFNQINKMVLMK